MTTKIIAILIGGLIFFFIGFLICRFYKWKSIKGYIPLIIGISLIYISTIGPLADSKSRIDELLEIDANEVESIIIMPTDISSYKEINLIRSDTILTDRILIDKICKSLNKANIEGEGFMKSPENVCRIQINMTNKNKLVLGLRKAKRVTCLNLSSNGESGWHYGNIKANEFGLIIDSVVK